MVLIGVYWAGCALLVVAGAAKALRPTDTARAVAAVVRGVGLVAAVRVVRTLAVGEAALGLVAIASPTLVPALFVMLSYLAFAAFVLAARRVGGSLATCGCFGTPDTAPTRLHAVLDLGFASAALVVALRSPGPTIGSALSGQPLAGVPLLVMAATLAYVAALALSGLGRLDSARRSVSGP